MIWNDAVLEDELDTFLAPRVEEAGQSLATYIRAGLGQNEGSVVPFVASDPNEWPYAWDNVLQESVQYEAGETPLQAVVGSDAVDEHVHVGHHFSADEEFGHDWDGWAWDFMANKIVRVAPPHAVEARPFMRRGLYEHSDRILQIIQEGGE